MKVASMISQGVIFKECEGAGERSFMVKYLFWRGNSLYCRYPVPGWSESYPLDIKSTGTASDRQKCFRLGENKLAEIRVKLLNGTLFEIKKPIEVHRVYNPKFWRLVGRYWYFHLRFTKSGWNEKFNLLPSLKKFGTRLASEIYREDIELWLNEMIAQGLKVNTVNNWFAYICAVYNHANGEDNPDYSFQYNPTRRMQKLSGSNVRTFVLTQEKFERNFEYLKSTFPRHALFYLALWETGRRPQEVSLYQWEWIREVVIDGENVHLLFVPPEIAKTKEPDSIPLSNRLWKEISALAYRHGHIFRNRTGERLKSWRRPKDALFAKFGEDAGWFRDCRRGMITHKCEVEGHDPKNVQAISGHRTQSVFNRYRIGNIKNLIKVVNPPTNYRQFEAINEKSA